MANYKPKINPFTGQLQLVNSGSGNTFFWNDSPVEIVLINDNNWYELDVTAQTSLNAKYLLATTMLQKSTAGDIRLFCRRKGSILTNEVVVGAKNVNNIFGFFIIKLDSNRIFEYKVQGGATTLIITLGYIE